MDLLSPTGLGLLGLLAPLVVLYILKIKRQRRVVASTWLWSSAQRDLMARSPFKKLIAQIPLLLQALALVALAFALARPATRSREITGDHVAIVMDASASMSALAEGSPSTTTRMDQARQAAKDIVASLSPGSDALVLEAAREARVVAPLDRDAHRLREAIDRVLARDVEGDLGAAIALAVDRLKQLGGSRRIVVITDGSLAHAPTLGGVTVPMEVVKVGLPVDNAGIVRVDVRSGADPGSGREQVQAFLVVANFGQSPRDVYVTLREENASDVLSSRRLLVQPGERAPVVLTFFPSPADYRRGLLLELAPHDAMAVDDVAFARVPAGDKLPVYLGVASTGAEAGRSPWLERALASDPLVELHAGTLEALLASPSVPADAFVAIDGACPANAPGGDLLIVAPPTGGCFGTLVGRTLENPVITSWDTGDPRMRFVSLDGVHVARATALKPDGPSQELVRTQEATLVTDISSAARTGTLVGFDVGDSDWPLKASFVLFVRNLLEQARTHRAHGMTGPARAGEPMRLTLPNSATKVEVEGPGGERIELVAKNGLAVVPEIQHAGLYHVTWQGPQPGTMVVPANLTSEAESDLTPRPLDLHGGPVEVRDASTQPDAHSEWTWVAALIALAFVVFDVAWLTRRVKPTPLGAIARPERPQRTVRDTG